VAPVVCLGAAEKKIDPNLLVHLPAFGVAESGEYPSIQDLDAFDMGIDKMTDSVIKLNNIHHV
jgi:hypothetical protein